MDPYESPQDLVNVLLMSGYKFINQRCFFSSDLREQRVRAQRLHPSGEREEERLRAMRHSGNDLKHSETWDKRGTDKPPGGQRKRILARTQRRNSSQRRDVTLFFFVFFSSEDFIFIILQERNTEMTGLIICCRERRFHMVWSHPQSLCLCFYPLVFFFFCSELFIFYQKVKTVCLFKPKRIKYTHYSAYFFRFQRTHDAIFSHKT